MSEPPRLKQTIAGTYVYLQDRPYDPLGSRTVIRLGDHSAVVRRGEVQHYPWRGDGPEPARWIADDGAIVYRSYADYCDG